MTLVELQNILGRNVESIMNAKTGNEIEVAKYNATYVTLIAKQMINNADVVLRTEKLIADAVIAWMPLPKPYREERTEE